MKSLEKRLRKLESTAAAVESDSFRDYIIHFVAMPPQNGEPRKHYPPIEEQIAEQRARGVKRIMVTSYVDD